MRLRCVLPLWGLLNFPVNRDGEHLKLLKTKGEKKSNSPCGYGSWHSSWGEVKAPRDRGGQERAEERECGRVRTLCLQIALHLILAFDSHGEALIGRLTSLFIGCNAT